MASWRGLVSVWGSLRVVLFILLVLISSLHTFLQSFLLLLPLTLLAPSWFSSLFSQIASFWHWYVVSLVEHLLRVKIVVTGSPPTDSTPVVMVMNHRTRLDWLFFFCCHARYATLGRLRICLKNELKHVPGAGWGIQYLVFLFVKRRWEHDQHVFNRCIQYYFRVGLTPHVLIFPEGTDFNPGSRAKSDKFAQTNNLPKYHHLLQPRTKGFIHMVTQMTQCWRSADIVDITVGYPHNVCQGEVELVQGNIPSEVHFHLDTVPGRSIPTDKEQLETWCHERWNRKERLLDNFTQHKCFPHDATYAPNDITDLHSSWKVSCRKLTAGVFWFSHTVASTLVLLSYPSLQIYYLCGVCLYAASVVGFSGLDILIPRLQSLGTRLSLTTKPTD